MGRPGRRGVGRLGQVPALSSTIWSFWHSSMKPPIRLANSTTYWMASVMRQAQRSHISSMDCKGPACQPTAEAAPLEHRDPAPHLAAEP